MRGNASEIQTLAAACLGLPVRAWCTHICRHVKIIQPAYVAPQHIGVDAPVHAPGLPVCGLGCIGKAYAAWMCVCVYGHIRMWIHEYVHISCVNVHVSLLG